jgi:hypothetical protein
MEKPGKTFAEEKEAALAAALRANLRRRKAGTRPVPKPDESDKRS